MPLVPGKLAAEVLRLTDESNPAFVGWPATTEEAAANWAAAVGAYLSDLTLPPGAGVASAASAPAAGLAMAGALASGADGLLELLTAFGAGIASATAAFSAIPGMFSLTPLPLSSSPEEPAQSFESDVTSWVGRGLWTPPLGSPTPWS